jgi:hypothetical protein
MIKEDLLHFIWKSHLVPKHGLKTTDDCLVDVVQTGVLNHDNGPDFLFSRIRMNGFLWVGNVELHVKSSDWYLHGHHTDKRYDNVILHVVYECDKEVINAGGVVPCIELKQHISPDLITKYIALQQSHSDVPCFQYEINDFKNEFNWMRDKLLAERLSRRIQPFLNSKYADAHVFRKFLLQALGGTKNRFAFTEFSERINWIQLERWINRPDWIITYLFSLSGLFEKELTNCPQAQQIKPYINRPLSKESWNTRGIRPGNQPKVRIRQFVDLFTQGVLVNLHEAESPTDFSLMWSEELNRLKIELQLSDFLIQNIAINAVVPFLFYQGIKKSDSSWIDFAFEHLEEWKPEKNAIVLKFKQKGVVPITASDTQAILELYRYYCSPKKCVSCTVGNKLMRA